MTFQNFEDIQAWQHSIELGAIIYATFSELKDFGFRNQICRAVVSVSNNIAEGFERRNNRAFKQVLRYALGSASEIRSMVYLGAKLKYIDKYQERELLERCVRQNKMIYGLIKVIAQK